MKPKIIFIFLFLVGFFFLFPSKIKAACNGVCDGFVNEDCVADCAIGNNCAEPYCITPRPPNVCCNGAGHPACTSLPLWTYLYNARCVVDRYNENELRCSWHWEQQQCPATDTCKLPGTEPYLYPGQCVDSGCAVGGTRYKVCCNSDGTVDGGCDRTDGRTEYNGTCPTNTTTRICGVSQAVCNAVFPASCTTVACDDRDHVCGGAIVPTTTTAPGQPTSTPIPTPPLPSGCRTDNYLCFDTNNNWKTDCIGKSPYPAILRTPANGSSVDISNNVTFSWYRYCGQQNGGAGCAGGYDCFFGDDALNMRSCWGNCCSEWQYFPWNNRRKYELFITLNPNLVINPEAPKNPSDWGAPVATSVGNDDTFVTGEGNPTHDDSAIQKLINLSTRPTGTYYWFIRSVATCSQNPRSSDSAIYSFTISPPAKSCQVGITINTGSGAVVPTINPNTQTYTLANGNNVTFSATTTGGNGNLWLEKTYVQAGSNPAKRYTTNDLGSLTGIGAGSSYTATDNYGQTVTSTYYRLDNNKTNLSKNLSSLALPTGTDYALHCDVPTNPNQCSGNPLCDNRGGWAGTLKCLTASPPWTICTSDWNARPDFLFFNVAAPSPTPTCAPPSRPQCNNSEVIIGSDVTLTWTAPGSWGGPACIASKLFHVYTSPVSPGSNYPATFTIRPGVDSEISGSPFGDTTFTTTLTNQAIGDHFWFLSASNSLASTWSYNICSYNISANVDWWQTKDGDVHAQNNISSNIPGTATYPSLSLDGDGGNPGVVSYNGDLDINGQELSSTGWQAKTSFASGLLLNYNFFQNKLGIGATAFSAWPPTSSGVYRYSSGTLVLDGAVDLNNNEKIIILADGDVEINDDIIVREGSFLAIIAGGNINFDKQVERAQGFYLANSQIIVEGTDNGVDSQFLGQGSFVALTGFLFQRRIAPGQSKNVASEYFQPRPDLYINAPLNFLLNTYSDFEELAP